MKNQSTIIVGAVLLAFIVFITIRGDLPDWLALFSKQGKHENISVSTSTDQASTKKSGGGLIGGLLGKILPDGGILGKLLPGKAGDIFNTASTIIGKAVLPVP